MSIPLTDVVYPLDESGQSPSNRIINERHELTTTSWSGFNLIIPEAAPFFDDSLGDELIHYPSGDRLLRGRDWITGWMFKSATGEIGAFVSSCIYILDTQLRGQVEIPSYQCLGGEWQINKEQLERILADKLLNPNRYYWEFVVNLPQIFRPLDHDQDIDEVSELGLLLDELRGIAIAIREASESGALEEHEAKRNPHKTRPADLEGGGLGNLFNWTVATLTEMNNPNALPTDRYMSPPVVKRLIDLTAMASIDALIARRDNPNRVDAHQAGTLFTAEIHALIQEYLSGGTGYINALTLEGKSLQGVIDESVLAIRPILDQNYNDTIASVSTQLENFVALDTAKFAGQTSQQWDQRIQNLIEAGAGTTMLPSVFELLEPEFPDPGYVAPDILPTEPTTTQLAIFSKESNPRWADTCHLLIMHAGVTYSVTFYPLTGNCVIWSDKDPSPGVSFFIDESGETDHYRIWMNAPADRVGMVIVNDNMEKTTVGTGMIIFGDSTAVKPWVNNRSDKTVKVLSSTAELATVIQAQAALGVRMTSVEQVNTTQDQAITAINARPRADLILVNATQTIPVGATTFNLTTLITALGLQAQYDLSKAMVYVRIKNTDDDSPNKDSWINAEGACSYGMRANLTTAFVYNHTSGPIDAYIRVSVPKN